MNIYLIRHGKSEKPSEKKPGEKRELTSDGRIEVQKSANFWKQYINKIDIILSSPLTRAFQTAEIVKSVFNCNSEILKETTLLNGGQTEDLLNVVNAYGKEDTVLVGHQPDIAEHISRMIAYTETNLKIPPASITKISFKSNLLIGEGILEFLIPPVNKKG